MIATPTIDALATLGFDGRRADWARGQLLAALKILQNGDVDRARMVRSWAGAMTVKDAGETSMILAWPVWIPQAFMVPGFALLAVAGGYLCVHQLRLAARGTP